MAIPFTHSMQALHADRMQSTVIGITIAGLFFCLWALWFFLAPITLYENGQIVGFTRDGTLLARFPAPAAAKIARGQPVRIRLRSLPDTQSGEIPSVIAGIVAGITQHDADGSVQVALNMQLSAETKQILRTDPTQQETVEVEVAQLSPALLIAHAAGFVAENGRSDRTISFSPTQ